MGLDFLIHFDIYILNDHDLAYWGADYNSVLKHEISCHCLFVAEVVESALAKIEETWKKERLTDPQKALDNAYKSFEKATQAAERLSKRIFDSILGDILERYYRYWEEIGNDWVPWKNDPFMTWALRIDI
jgi:hypothetical protein